MTAYKYNSGGALTLSRRRERHTIATRSRRPPILCRIQTVIF